MQVKVMLEAWVDGQCCPEQSDSLEKINKNCIDDCKRLECHKTLLSEIINGIDCSKIPIITNSEFKSSLNYHFVFLAGTFYSARAPITD